MYNKGKINIDRYNKGLPFKDLFLKCLNADCDYIAVENPTPLKLWNLPPYTQVIQPWMFGENYTKRTCLWNKGLPDLKPDVTIKPNTTPYVNAVTYDYYHKRRKNKGVTHTAIDRSKTFMGIARAFAD